jgi:putative spermidine/putrescine transport system substrate-binding protein
MHMMLTADEKRFCKRFFHPRIAAALARARLSCRGVCSGYLTFLIGAVICLGVCLASPVKAEEKILRVLAWPGYADADVVKNFEARYQVKVEVTLVDSDEALWAQMHAKHAPPFDVLAANTAEIQRYTQANLLAPLDLASLPNTKKQLPRFQALASIGGITSGGKAYAIPFTYSSMGLIYDRK